MGFLSGKRTTDRREAREILDLAELLDECAKSGPVSLEVYARIRCREATSLESAEGNARKLARRLRAKGYVIDLHGDGEAMTVDLRDRALRAEVERSLSWSKSNVSHTHQGGESIQGVYALGLSVGGTASAVGLPRDKVYRVLRTLGPLRHEGRPRVEERRSAEVIERAIEEGSKPGHVSRVARVLGCDRQTARRFLRRLARPHPPASGPS